MKKYGSPITGETVTLRLRQITGVDEFGDDVYVMTEPITVNNVLVNPSTTTYDRIIDGHPEAIECDLVLYWPREFTADMRKAQVTVRGIDYVVIGSPTRYTDANLPYGCEWNLVTKVVRYDG